GYRPDWRNSSAPANRPLCAKLSGSGVRPVADPAGVEVRIQLEDTLTGTRVRALSIERPCPGCRGSGVRRVQVMRLNGEIVEQETPGVMCPVCRGRRTLAGRRTAAERTTAQGAVLQTYQLEQQRLGREDWLGIWVPAGLAEQFRARESAALRKAFGVWCSTCSGSGRRGCEPCGGTGIRACSNGRCIQGTEICPECNGSGRTQSSGGSRSLTRGCTACNSTGKRTCSTCEGKGFLVCAPCQGRGEILCARCGGSGQNATCNRCTGSGLADCTACRGTGVYRNEICAVCKGDRVLLCRTCNGAGRALR
ncbi:MAG: hypothetical protein U1E27_00385, partial [Kiritimatiellia bacterium]|nr:hypothetical protein [Kiritimatiellia bacterium]